MMMHLLFIGLFLVSYGCAKDEERELYHLKQRVDRIESTVFKQQCLFNKYKFDRDNGVCVDVHGGRIIGWVDL